MLGLTNTSIHADRRTGDVMLVGRDCRGSLSRELKGGVGGLCMRGNYKLVG